MPKDNNEHSNCKKNPKKTSSEEANGNDNDTYDEIHTFSTTLAVKAPKISTSLHRLQPRIDLNLPPDNWLRSNPYENLDGFNTKHYLKDKFSSIRMAFQFSDLEPPADVITASKNIKKLLKMALTNNDGLSMIVHPIGKSLLIDEFDVHKQLMRQEPEWRGLRDFFLQKVLESKATNKAIVRKNHSHDAVTERNLVSKLLYYSIPHESPTFEKSPIAYHSNSTQKSEQELNQEVLLQNFPQLPEPKPEEVFHDVDSNDRNSLGDFGALE